MSDYLPAYYGESVVMRNIIDREGAELGRLNAAAYDVLAQFFVDTATWGLANWERVCGLPTDLTKPIEQRRAIVKARLRGIGTVTVALIKSVAEAYDNGEVDVREDNANYTIIITFISTRGVPPDIDDIKAALREIIPAHLAINYEFTYLQWAELDAENWTWDAFDAMGFTWDTLEVYRPE